MAILKDWSDRHLRDWRYYIAGELAKFKDPDFLAEYDLPEGDRSRHLELYARATGWSRSARPRPPENRDCGAARLI
ncbi:MAG: hypothetical protein H0X34_01945 [Chthoniobacterales bacterium]|nr:hypothetical protein [Chthoniobacterales bacterium]